MTSPAAGRAAIEILGDTSKFLGQLQRDIDRALRSLRLDMDPVTDKAGRAFKEVSRDAERAFDQVGRDADQAAERVGAEMARGGERAERALGEIGDRGKREFDRIQREARASADNVGSGFNSAAGTIRTTLLTISAAAVTGLSSITGFGLKAAGELEQGRIAFQSLLGGVEAGNKVFADLQKFAAVTPFEFPDVLPFAQKFLAFNDAVGLGDEQLQAFLGVVGDVVSVTGGGAEALDSVALAFAHMASGGKVSLEDINILSDALPGFSGVAAIAAARGITAAEAMKQISAGTISATEGTKALIAGMEEFPGAAGAMEKQSQTLLGVFSTFKDTIGQALAGAFEPAIPAIKSTLTQLTPIIGDALTSIGPALGHVLTGLLSLAGDLVKGVVPILIPVLTAVGEAFTQLGETGALTDLGTALGALARAIVPLLPLIVDLIVLWSGAMSGALRLVAGPLTDVTEFMADNATQVQVAVGAYTAYVVATKLLAFWENVARVGRSGDIIAWFALRAEVIAAAAATAAHAVAMAAVAVATAVARGAVLLWTGAVVVARTAATLWMVVTSGQAAALIVATGATIAHGVAVAATAVWLGIIKVATVAWMVVQNIAKVATIAWTIATGTLSLAQIGAAIAVAAHGVAAVAATAAMIVAKVATLAWRDAQLLLNLAMNANPIGAVIAIVALLVAAFTIAMEKSDGFRAAVLGLFGQVDATNTSMVGMQTTLGKNSEALAVASSQAAEAAGVEKTLAGSIQDVAAAGKSLITVWDELHGKMATTDETALAAKQAVAALAQTFKDNGAAIQGNSIAALSNRVAMEGAARKAAEAAQAYLDQTHDVQGAARMMDTFRNEAVKQTGATGKAKDAVAALAREVFKLPKNQVTQISVRVIGLDKLRTMNSMLVAAMQASGQVTTEGRAPGRPPGMAVGGFTTREGWANLHPQELVLPLEDTRAVDLLARALAEADAGLRNSGAPTVGGGDLHIQVFLGTREISDIVDVRVAESNRSLKRSVTAGAGNR